MSIRSTSWNVIVPEVPILPRTMLLSSITPPDGRQASPVTIVGLVIGAGDHDRDVL